MNTKQFNGKAIYNPSGKAGEYSYWACNFYTGCSNGCTYCYCRKGVMSHVWSDKPQLKKCFKDEKEALSIFEKELLLNIAELQKNSLFFTFTSDPMLPVTIELTRKAISICIDNFVPVKILTKRADFLNKLNGKWSAVHWSLSTVMKAYIAFGFTLTGHDELEIGASMNAERIETMKKLHEAGFKTFASIEPIVDFVSAYSMINLSRGACDLYKIGLMSGKKYTARERSDAQCFFEMLKGDTGQKYYLKDTLITLLKLDRNTLPEHFVRRDYNLFEGR